MDRLSRLTFLLLFILITSGCAPTPAPTLFVPPTQPPQLIQVTATVVTAVPTTIPTIVIPTPTPICSNNLSYLQDLTFPDGTNVQPGQSIDKQWLVSNSGSCDWDDRYQLKMMSGDSLDASTSQILYPARSGSQAKLHIIFTAPQAAGTYQSVWQAYAPDGTVFGDSVSIKINVTP